MRLSRPKSVLALTALASKDRLIRRGDLLHANDPIVLANPSRFIPDSSDLSDADLDREWRNRSQTPPTAKSRPLRDRDAVIATETFTALGPEGPIEVTRGDRLHYRDWVARHESRRFVSIAEFERRANADPRRLRPHERASAPTAR